jgi:hypothetical protein
MVDGVTPGVGAPDAAKTVLAGEVAAAVPLIASASTMPAVIARATELAFIGSPRHACPAVLTLLSSVNTLRIA